MTTSTVKCLVWDLDDTLWDGVLLEGDQPRPREDAMRTLRTLDHRGILHAVASRGHYDTVLRHLTHHRLDDLFCAVQVGWGTKSAAIVRVADELNIAAGALAFVDNDTAELAEVSGALPSVRCYPAEQVAALPDLEEFRPPFVTAESRRRRSFYQTDHRRRTAEQDAGVPAPEFLASLDLEMTVRRAGPDDLARVHELTLRTHQLNTTGRTYDLDELRELTASPGHEVLVAELADRFGEYGTIGLAVTELAGEDSILLLLLTSCRVMSRGAGGALLDHLVHTALAAGKRPVAHYTPTPVNRIMLITLRFAGYEVQEENEATLVLAVDPAKPPMSRPTAVRVNRWS
ncbi:HAD-IIIC family phosphatase [Umezawaea sp. Da 62-37]|uniref:HAD-IIIC family phosphatase n=1 Tax=Umezawaea sp. Da 62-37 TaxID=3075927 RepID=UPI0028F7435B|nr:HAD-IIIC family phosphatase [Umezawaea sp. Da 62-37]WNV85205.1 HAD-IIIC family phosphatase [Umezawaea sp. Da 62-37]